MHQSCHHCDYDLMGLPDRGTCPECGETYDKHSIYRAARAKQPEWTRHVKWGFLAGFTLIVLLGGVALAISSKNAIGILIITLIVSGVSGLGAYAYWSAEQKDRREAD